MKITLDHNCLINLANNTEVGKKVKVIVESDNTECFVVNIGASEMRERGILPDRYDLFDTFLCEIKLNNLERINPLMIWDVTFWDNCVWAGDEDLTLTDQIETILFPNKLEGTIKEGELDSKLGKKWLNRTCDIQSMWCHISNGNDIFLTADKNFMKETKKPKLIELGAKEILHPYDINV